MTFDTTYEFEELPCVIGDGEYALFNGTAHLQEDKLGDTSYSFIVTAIELSGNERGNYGEGRSVTLIERHDDLFCRLLFERLSIELYGSKDCQELFAAELALTRFEGVA